MYGKTGTTNDALDAWFVGFQPTVSAAAWVGYDSPRSLGDRESGGGLGLPIWIEYMRTALKGVPLSTVKAPSEGLTRTSADWYYTENLSGNKAVRGIGLTDPLPAGGGGAGSGTAVSKPKPKIKPKVQSVEEPAAEVTENEKTQILDLFKE